MSGTATFTKRAVAIGRVGGVNGGSVRSGMIGVPPEPDPDATRGVAAGGDGAPSSTPTQGKQDPRAARLDAASSRIADRLLHFRVSSCPPTRIAVSLTIQVSPRRHRLRMPPLTGSCLCVYDPRTHMDRRNPNPETHPPVSGFPCPSCSSVRVRLATVADFFFYLRCDDCTFVWSHPERRQMMDRRLAGHDARNTRAS